MNILEQHEIREAGRQEARAAAIRALEEHLVRISGKNQSGRSDQPFNVGYREAISFAITLVKLAI